MTDHLAIQHCSRLSPKGGRLFEEERYAGAGAPVAHGARPGDVVKAVVRPGLTTIDDPVDPMQHQVIQRAERRLVADESYGRGNLPERVSAPSVLIALDASTEPHVWVLGAPVRGQALGDAAGPLGQQQPVEPRSSADERPELLTLSLDRAVVLAPVHHRAGEHPAMLLVAEGLGVPPLRLRPMERPEHAPRLVRPPYIMSISP